MSNLDVTHFLPGQNLTIRPEWRRPAFRRYGRTRVNAPGRVHLTVFNFLKMAPGLGGGGLGISVDTAHSELVISVGERQVSNLSPTGRHLLTLFQQCIGYERDDVRIAVPHQIQYLHAGFGSNVTFNTALLAGLNAMFGSPFSVSELWDMLTHNYVENATDGEHIYFGLDTGVGEACVLYGGLVWVDEGAGAGDGRCLGSLPAEHLWVVTCVGKLEQLAGDAMRAFGKAAAEGLGDQREADIVAGLCQDYQRHYGPALHGLLDSQLRPAFLRGDLKGLLACGWAMNEIGNMKVLEGIYQPGVLRELTATMREAGSLYAGMSSAGPGFFAFADSEGQACELRNVIERRFSGYFGDFAVARAGTKLSIELEGAASRPLAGTPYDNHTDAPRMVQSLP